MAKRNHQQNVGACVCSHCGTEANSTIGKPHRKCRNKDIKGRWLPKNDQKI